MSEAKTSHIALSPGTVIAGRYTIEQVLGIGGFGITYRAVGADGRALAVKEYFRSSLCSRRGTRMEYSEPVTDEVLAGMRAFVNEGKRLASIAGRHHNIVEVSEIAYDNDTVYIAMELIGGKDLDAMMRTDRAGSPMGEAEAVEAMMPIVDAVAMLHADSIAHLDIKPANIIMSESGQRPVLIDFGLSKHYDQSGAATTASTMAGCSPGYAPPEQYAGDVAAFSPQSDVYALGATLFFLLTGHTPPTASNAGSAVIERRLLDAGVGRSVASVIGRSMSTTLADRQDDAAMLGRELRAAVSADSGAPQLPAARRGVPAGWLRSRLAAIAAIAVFVALGAVGAYMWLGSAPVVIDDTETAAPTATASWAARTDGLSTEPQVGYTVYGEDIYANLEAPGARLNLDIMPLDAVVGDSIIVEIGLKTPEAIADAEAVGMAIRPQLKYSRYGGFIITRRASGSDSVTIYSYLYLADEAGVEAVPAGSVSIGGDTVAWDEHLFEIHGQQQP